MILFIDTNIILHFVPLDQINWLEVCGEEKVKIMFSRIVIAELDKHKRNPNSRIRKVARDVLRKIDDIGTSGSWGNNIQVEVITKRPKDDIYTSNSLDKEEQDDQLIASILDFVPLEEEEIKLVTNDLGPKLKSKSLGIEVLSLPDKYELKNEEEELIKENNRLRDQITKYTSGIPKLSLCFQNGKKFHSLKLNKFDFTEFRTLKRKEIETKYPYMEIPKPPVGTPAWLIGTHPLVNKETITRYNSELSKFYEEYERFLSECEKYFKTLELTSGIRFKLINEGSVPANDIDINLHFPDGFSLEKKKPRNMAEKPNPPIKPGDALKFGYTHWYPTSTPNINLPDISSIGGLSSIKKTKSYDVDFNYKSLKHNQDIILDELFLIFDSPDEAKGFSIDYKIFAANIPDVISGQLNLVVEK